MQDVMNDRAVPGHNSAPADKLRQLVERIERLEEERRETGAAIRDIYHEAKATGFDVKALREVIRIRREDADERAEREAMRETYLNHLNGG